MQSPVYLQNPEIRPYRYFGGSKLSCHGCGILFASFNSVAASLGHSTFFTKGCHDKIYLRWPYPSLLSQEQLKQLQPNALRLSLDFQVKEKMIEALHNELVAYVSELHEATKHLTPAQLDSTSTSGDSRDPAEVFDFFEMESVLNQAIELLE
jgi:hypothetical protein